MTDKKWYQSKKFISFVISLAALIGVLVVALITQTFGWAMSLFMAIGIFAVGAITIAYVNGQATLDKFVEAVKGLSINEDNKKDLD